MKLARSTGSSKGAQGSWDRMRAGRLVEGERLGSEVGPNVEGFADRSSGFSNSYLKCMASHWMVLSQGILRPNFTSDYPVD